MRFRNTALLLVLALTLIADGRFEAQNGPPTYSPTIVHVGSDELKRAVTEGHLSGAGTNELVPRDPDLGIRVSVGRKLATPPATGSEAHETFGHVYRIESGSATLVLGGELVDPRERAPGEWVGSGIRGGQEFYMSEGDMITVQVGMPHQWTEVAENGVAYLAFHSFPD